MQLNRKHALQVIGTFTMVILAAASIWIFSTRLLPVNCESAELAVLREMISQVSEEEARQLLQQKLNLTEREAAICAQRLMQPIPAKPDPDAAIPTESAPLPVSTAWVGIHEATNPPSGMNIANMWTGIVNGNFVEIFAGALADEAWQEHPELPGESAVFVLTNGSETKIVAADTRSGPLQFVEECGAQLILQSQDGNIFVFDITTLMFTTGESCS